VEIDIDGSALNSWRAVSERAGRCVRAWLGSQRVVAGRHRNLGAGGLNPPLFRVHEAMGFHRPVGKHALDGVTVEGVNIAGHMPRRQFTSSATMKK
jgi:hypothetical protein